MCRKGCIGSMRGHVRCHMCSVASSRLVVRRICTRALCTQQLWWPWCLWQGSGHACIVSARSSCCVLQSDRVRWAALFHGRACDVVGSCAWSYASCQLTNHIVAQGVCAMLMPGMCCACLCACVVLLSLQPGTCAGCVWAERSGRTRCCCAE